MHVVVAPDLVHGELRLKHPRLRLVRDAGYGLYCALNLGLASVTEENWEWFTYLNDDDVWESPGFANAFLEAVSAEVSVGIVYGRVRIINSNSCSMGEIPIARCSGDLRSLLSVGIIPFAQPGTLIRREVVESLKGFDESYRSAGDLDLLVRALISGWGFRFCPKIVASFRLHAGQISKDENTACIEKEVALRRLHGKRLEDYRFAVIKFRLGNSWNYAQRILRFGWVGMKDVYQKS